MEHFTKPHLPLISQRIVFERKTLPPRPNITHRLNLAQRIRRTERVRFSSTAPRHKSKEPTPSHSRNASRSTTPAPADSLSDLSELSDNDDDNDPQDSIDGDSVGSFKKIPKPPGSIGRQAGGFNLEAVLKNSGWEEDKYKKLIAWINTQIKDKLDGSRTFMYQDKDVMKKLFVEGTRKFDIEGLYENNWPVREGFKMRLKTVSELLKRKGKGVSEKQLRQVLEDAVGKPKVVSAA